MRLIVVIAFLTCLSLTGCDELGGTALSNIKEDAPVEKKPVAVVPEMEDQPALVGAVGPADAGPVAAPEAIPPKHSEERLRAYLEELIARSLGGDQAAQLKLFSVAGPGVGELQSLRLQSLVPAYAKTGERLLEGTYTARIEVKGSGGYGGPVDSTVVLLIWPKDDQNGEASWALIYDGEVKN